MGFCFGIKGLRGCWLTLHTRRPEQCRDRTRDGAPADRDCTDFPPVHFFFSSSFFFPWGLGASLCFVVICYILFSSWPLQIKLTLRRQTWMHSRSPSLKQFFFFTPVFIWSCCFTLWGQGGRELVDVITQMCVGKTSVCNWSPPVPRLQQRPSHMAIAPRACSVHQR